MRETSSKWWECQVERGGDRIGRIQGDSEDEGHLTFELESALKELALERESEFPGSTADFEFRFSRGGLAFAEETGDFRGSVASNFFFGGLGSVFAAKKKFNLL